MPFTTRAYNAIDAYPKQGLLVKRSTTERLADEIRYYEQLPSDVAWHFPRVRDSLIATNGGEHTLSLELYGYGNLARPMLGNNDYADYWEEVFDCLGTILETMLKHSITELSTNVIENRKGMYIDKTEKEYAELLKNPIFSDLAKHSHININGIQYKNFDNIWPTIREYLVKECEVIKYEYAVVPTVMCSKDLSIIHGDLCFSNILAGMADGHVVVKLIDPRGSFGEKWNFGDPYYDYAKLAHSCDGGYEFFIYDKFQIKHNQELSEFYFDEPMKKTKESIHGIFSKWLDVQGIDKHKVKVIQGTIFMGMIARHYDSIERQKAMYLTGIRILNECL